MSIKSIFRAVGGLFTFQAPMSTAPTQMAVTDRLKGRSDWRSEPQFSRDYGAPYGEPLPVDPAPTVAPWDARTPVWPPHDDPYKAPPTCDPCDVVQDEGLGTIRDYAARTNENSRRLAERGLSGRPMDSVKSVTDLLQLIERQEMAERELIHRGMEWDPVTRRWLDPDTQP